MTDLVYDFKDIASRMKGEAKPAPKVELMPPPPSSWFPIQFCAPCNGSGVDPMHGGHCHHCHGKGVSP